LRTKTCCSAVCPDDALMGICVVGGAGWNRDRRPGIVQHEEGFLDANMGQTAGLSQQVM
jgi:hypothetical protein